MLTHISISNLATIQSLSMEIKPGFTVLTGETGAGKSILIDALRMVLGGRTSGHLVRSGAPQAVVEAVFDIASLPEVRGRLEEIGIPSGGDLVIRRLILNNGKNRALANDCAITQSKLEDVGKYLVNIHGQHDNQMLLDTKSHIYFLDGFGQLGELRGEVSQSFRQYTDLSREKKELLEQSARREARIQELKDTLEELTLAGLKHDEEGELLHEHTLLTHSEKLAQHITSIQVGLYEGEDSVISRLGQISQALQQAAGIDQTLEPLAAQLAPMGYQLEDIYRSLSQYGGRLEADPARLDFVNNRLALIERMKRRYGGSVESALAELARGGEELSRLENLESSMDELDRKISQVAGCLHSFSQELSARRRQTAAEMDRLVMEQLLDLGMEKAEFKTQVIPAQTSAGVSPAYTSLGMDQVVFELAPNPGQGFKPLEKIASGGELSRIMLALKTVLAKTDPTRTLIFDEVDSGISGGVAEKVGQKQKMLGKTHQVLCITHLPQIAALGHHHLLVQKISGQDQTFTRVSELAGEEKISEVARLLSGLNISAHSIRSAEDMVKRGSEAAD